MERPTASLAVLIVAAMTVVAVPAAGLGPGTITGGPGSVTDTEGVEANATNTQATANGSDNETPPGSMLTGVVGVQKAEIEGEVQSRSFEIALNRSDDNASKAAVIAGEITDLESRLETLEERKKVLDRARENNTIAEGEYRARIAEVSARISTVQRLANQTADASRGVPADTLNERGVNASTISEIRNRARNLSGPEIARIARGIAGPGVGMGLGGGPPANRTNPGQGNGPPGNGGGPPDDAGPGDGQRGGGEAGPPGSNDSNTGSNASSGDPTGPNGVDNGTDGPDRGGPGDGMEPPGEDTRGDNGTENNTQSGDRDTPDNGTAPANGE